MSVDATLAHPFVLLCGISLYESTAAGGHSFAGFCSDILTLVTHSQVLLGHLPRNGFTVS